MAMEAEARRPAAKTVAGEAALAAASGLLLFAAFPPLDWAFLVWVALVPLFYLMLTRPLLDSLQYALVTGLLFFGPLLYYVGQFGLVPWLALALFESLFFVLVALLAGLLVRRVAFAWRPWALAAAFTLVMYLRGHIGALSLPLGEPGYALHSARAVIHLAALFGVHGLTFLIALVNASLAAFLAAGSADVRALARSSYLVAAVLTLVVAGGLVRGHMLRRGLDEPGARRVRAAAVQAARFAPRRVGAAFVRSTVDAYSRLSLLTGAEFIVWPETAMLAAPSHYPDVEATVKRTARRCQAWLLFGNAPLGADGRSRNAATLLDPEGEERGRYDKVHLVLFGEYVPYRETFPFLERFPVRDFDYAPGEGLVLMETDGLRFGPLICFESLLPEMSREVVRRGSEILVIVTSDAWAGRSAELEQHAACSVLRAVETGRYLVRAATTGITCIIGPDGQILSSVPAYKPGSAVADIIPRRELTLYTRLGDWPLVGVCLALLVVPLVRRRLRPPATSAG